MFAGRNISATHLALSSACAAATCAVMGQAVGNAAYLCEKYSCCPSDVGEKHISELQSEIMNDGCLVPGKKREIPLCTRKATSSLAPDEKAELFSGVERPQGESKNYVSRETGGFIEYKFASPVSGTARLVLDTDFSRTSVWDENSKKMKMPANLARNLSITAVGEDGSKKILYSSDNNYRHIILAPTHGKISSLRADFNGAWYSTESRIFSFDLMEDYNRGAAGEGS